MSGNETRDETLDLRRKRLRYRSWHRGMQEMDLIMGRFADAVIADLSAAELTEFERLSDVPDPDLYAWVAGQSDVPADFDTVLFRRLRDFHSGKRR